jgi:hypothetical protein
VPYVVPKQFGPWSVVATIIKVERKKIVFFCVCVCFAFCLRNFVWFDVAGLMFDMEIILFFSIVLNIYFSPSNCI